MTTVIGLKSGKEFVVKDAAYFFTLATTGAVVSVFESVDGKRSITVPNSIDIEYFDEPMTEQRLADMQSIVEYEPEKKEENIYDTI